ncbi:MAG: ribulose-phosphate 3-epimerase [Defluviitaleaceae bacterium]|nr:ribulose-phosphate 3-epimerase [Defluviitaleaceae bacterium]
MNKLAPSLLAANFSNLEKDIKILENEKVDYLHIDVMDGHFVPNISFGIPILESIRKITNLTFDCHLMITNPSKYIEEFCKYCDIITFHVEIEENINQNIKKVKEMGKKVGLAINPNTDKEKIIKYIKDLDMITVMSVEAGFGGQKFIPKSLETIKYYRDFIVQNNLKLDIEVDGGINLENVKSVLDVGANVVVAGSSILRANDIRRSVREFLSIMS